MKLISGRATISPLADVEDSIRGSRLVIGDDSMIDAFVKLKFAGGSGDVVIGARTYINSCCVLYSGHGLTIGNDVMIAANCTFAAANHAFARTDITMLQQGFQPSRGGIVIEDDVWIGANCVLLDGAVVRKGAVVGAHSLVRGELAPYSINMGVPARQVATR